MKIVGWLGPVAGAVLAAGLGITPVDSSAGAGKKLALLVGINAYKWAGDIKPALNGCERDAREMALLLHESFGFPKENVLLLVGGDRARDELKGDPAFAGYGVGVADRQTVIDSFRNHLVRNAEADSVVVFFFSGHGSQIEDVSRDEEYDRWDETLVLYDSGRTGDKAFDLRDDEIHALLRELREQRKTENVTLILDCCHSGSANRGFGTPKLSEQRETRPLNDPRYAGPGSTISDWEKQGGQPRSLYADTVDGTEDYVVITGCSAGELSYEIPVQKRKMGGALTHFLVEAIRDSPPGRATYREVFERCYSKVKAANRLQNPGLQHPSIEGNLDRPVFGVGKLERPSSFLVELVPPEKAGGTPPAPVPVIRAGAAHGFAEGSEFALYPTEAESFPTGSELALVTLDQVEAAQSTFRFEGREIAVTTGLKAVPRKLRYALGKFPVHFGEARPGTALAALKDTIGEAFELVADPADAKIRLAEGALGIEAKDAYGCPLPVYRGAGDFLEQARQAYVKQEGPLSVWLDSSEASDPELVREVGEALQGDDRFRQVRGSQQEASLILSFPPGGGVQGLDRVSECPVTHLLKAPRELLDHWAKWHNIIELENRVPHSLRLELQIKVPPDAEAGTAGDGPPPGNNLAGKTAAAGGELLRTFLSGEAFDLVVKNTGTRAFYFALFDMSSDGGVTALEHHVSEALEPGREVTIPLQAVELPSGVAEVVDFFKVIATADPLPLENLQLRSVRVKGLAVRSSEDPLFELLSKAAGHEGAARTRGIPVDKEWTTTVVPVRRIDAALFAQRQQKRQRGEPVDPCY